MLNQLNHVYKSFFTIILKLNFSFIGSIINIYPFLLSFRYYAFINEFSSIFFILSFKPIILLPITSIKLNMQNLLNYI